MSGNREQNRAEIDRPEDWPIYVPAGDELPVAGPGEIRIYLNEDGSAYATAGGPVVFGNSVEEAIEAALDAAEAGP